MSRVYTSPYNEIVRIAAWTRDENGQGYEVAIYPEAPKSPSLSLIWHMSADDARRMAAMLVSAADAVAAGVPEDGP